MQQYNCPTCGSPIAFGVRLCGNCGALLAVGAKEEGQGTSPWLRILVVSIAVVFLFGGISFAFGSCSPTTTSSPPLPASGPVINSFTANPTSLTEGNSCTLAWDVTGATSVVIDSGVGAVPVSGHIETKPSTTTTYTLIAIATNTPGRVTKSVTVTVTASASPPPVTESPSLPPATAPVGSPPEKTYDPSLPAGMGAFRGKVLWGDKPLLNSEVVADTQSPVYYTPTRPTKVFSTKTDKEGNYRLIVEAESYYIGCTMLGSDDISYVYETITVEGRPILLGPPSHSVESGEVVTVDLQAIDWSIELVSPGDADSDTSKTIAQNPPTLMWKEYDWTKYGEVGYYQVELNGEQVIKDKTGSNSYIVPNPLNTGKYSWEVKAYTKTDKPIAGYIDKRYFVVP